MKNKLNEAGTKWQLLVMLFLMIKEKKKWWLLPLFLLLMLLSLFINIFNNQAILPAIYSFF
jgi:CHASE1-domain containing sensor protein